jgi:phosphoglycolate phosphatase-like HAD superfamily hydrolase
MPTEIIRPDFPRGPYRLVLWDFDGTLSLYRGGWQQVMVEMMVEALAACDTSETRESLAAHAEEWVVTLNGKPTIHQMTKLAEEVGRRGGSPRDPLEYCSLYQDQLLALVNERMAMVARGERQPLDHGVAGVENMLERLAQQNMVLVLASGTEQEYVSRELHALGLQRYFAGRVYAPHGHDKQFSKAGVIERLMQEFGISGEQIVSFGDGIVETAEVKRVGGCAVGVASDENGNAGPDRDKRRRLIEAGADIIVPNFLYHEELAQMLQI